MKTNTQEAYTMTLYYNKVRQNARNAVYPHKIVISNTEDLKIAVSYDHVCAEYKDSYRKNANFIQADCIIAKQTVLMNGSHQKL